MRPITEITEEHKSQLTNKQHNHSVATYDSDSYPGTYEKYLNISPNEPKTSSQFSTQQLICTSNTQSLFRVKTIVYLVQYKVDYNRVRFLMNRTDRVLATSAHWLFSHLMQLLAPESFFS
jgi:hypothetical protein